MPTSADTTLCFISQAKNVSPASPDQSVPSQSKAATCSSSRKTDSINFCAVRGIVCVLTLFMYFDDNVGGGKCAIVERGAKGNFRLQIADFRSNFVQSEICNLKS